MKGVFAKDMKVGVVYQTTTANGHNLILVRQDAIVIVWLKNPSAGLGATLAIGNIIPDLVWEPMSVLTLDQKQLNWLRLNMPRIFDVCTCESIALFNSGCQCGHLKFRRT